ncbi:MAG TPA: hypothetical protein VJU78_03965 [Chitinophagaceae bacterium]|nr:hypothetical protein [Chitinophagaceae bacterium]
MKQVEIFKTNVRNKREAAKIIKLLLAHFPHYKINFDLNDCDNILRIETQLGDIDEIEIEQLIAMQGAACCHFP